MSYQREKKREVIELVTIISVVVLLAITAYRLSVAETKGKTVHVRELQGWYRMEGEEKIPVELPADLEPDGTGTLVLYCDSLVPGDENRVVATRGAAFELSMSMGDETLYRYDDTLFPRNEQMKGNVVCPCQLPAQVQGQVLRLEYRLDGKSRIPAVYIGGSLEVARVFLRQSIPLLLVTGLMLFGGLLSFAVGVYMKRMKVPDRRFFQVGGFLLLSVLWSFTDSTPASMFLSNQAAHCTVSFFCFMTMPIPIFHFIQDTVEKTGKKIMGILICLLYLNVLVQGILWLFGVLPMIRMLPVTHLLFVVDVALCVGVLLRESRINGNGKARAALGGFCALGGSGLLAILLYWAAGINYYSLIFEIGTLIFGMILFNEAILTAAKNFRDRTELAIFQRLAWEDQMTGLGNRRAFEADMEGFRTWNGKNAALIFADVNDLKLVNDTMGHNVGDEMIVAAAQCMEKIFGPFGKCYRLGGDEFCIVMHDVENVEEELLPRFDRELEAFSRDTRYDLSVARGMSYLRRPDGTVKTVSQWKTEADEKMYINKGEVKRR